MKFKYLRDGKTFLRAGSSQFVWIKAKSATSHSYVENQNAVAKDACLAHVLWNYDHVSDDEEITHVAIVKSYDSFLYREVFRVVEWKDDSILRTETTGKYISTYNMAMVPYAKFTLAFLSTSLTQSGKDLILPLISAADME